MGYQETQERYAKLFKVVEEDEERCCESPTCMLGVVWDLMQAQAACELKDRYIAMLQADLTKAQQPAGGEHGAE